MVILTHGEKLMLLVFRSKRKTTDVAAALGVCPNHLPGMYRHSFLHRKHIARICDVFGVDQSYFYDEMDKQRDRPEYVYLIRDHDNGLTKIGYSTNVQSRFLQLKRRYKNISILTYYRSGKVNETGLHKLFSSKRVVNEWFSLDNEDIGYISRYFDTISPSCDIRVAQIKKSEIAALVAQQ